MDDLLFDVHVPKVKLLIEYNGYYWHNGRKPIKTAEQAYVNRPNNRDLAKRKLALKNKYNFILIQEDEWRRKKIQIKNKIKRKLLALNKIIQ